MKEQKEKSFLVTLMSSSNITSSMRFIFLIGVPFTLIIWAVTLIISIFKLVAVPEGVQVLASVISAISFGAIGIIGSLAGMKAKQKKYEHPEDDGE